MKARNIKYDLHEYFSYGDKTLSTQAQALIIKTAIQDKNGYTKTKCKVNLPCKVDWCYACNGSGGRSKYDIEGYDINSMITDDGGHTDYDFKEDYFSGKTDITCNICNGDKIQNIVDWESCNELQLAILKSDEKCWQEEADDRAEQEAERRMGA